MIGHLVRFLKWYFSSILAWDSSSHLWISIHFTYIYRLFLLPFLCSVTFSGDPLSGVLKLLIELWIVRITWCMHELLQAKRSGEFQLWFLCPGWVFSPILFGGAVCTNMNVDIKFVRFAEISLIVLTVQFEFLLESVDAISILNMWFHCRLVLSCFLFHSDINLKCIYVLFIIWVDFHNDTFRWSLWFCASVTNGLTCCKVGGTEAGIVTWCYR